MKIVDRGVPLSKASKGLILLHGRGGTAEDILELSYEFCDDCFYVAAPQAPKNTWYPHSFMVDEKLNEPFLSESIATIKQLIDDIAKFIPNDQIYMMGFSQGACLVLEVTSRYATKYGGIASFTGGLIGSNLNEQKYQGDFEGTKVFIGNSDHDPHVPLERSEQTKAIMERLGAKVTLKVYKGMGHTVNEDEISSVKKLMFDG